MPVICEKISEKETPLISKANYMFTNEFVKVYPSKSTPTPLGSNWSFKPCVMPSKFEKFTELIENFTIRSDDVWVISYPKCGTTWTQAMVWMLLNNCDYDLERRATLSEKFPFLEMDTLVNIDIEDAKSIDFVDKLPSPRFIKSHLPVGLLPKQLWTVKPKIIYVARNPKDVAVSFYYHYRNLMDYVYNYNDFMDIFINNLTMYAPFHSHIVEFWYLRNETNILFIYYEDMKKDHLTVIKNTAKFLNVNYSDEKFMELKEHLTVDSMRLNSASNNDDLVEMTEKFGYKLKDPDFKFIRKGESGSYKKEMTPDLIQRFDDWTANEFKNNDFKFAI